MTDVRIQNYEALILFPQSASADLENSLEHVKEVLANRKAELLSIAKWDERRLAYDIHGNKRGLYLLAYFRSDTRNLGQIERDFTLSERVLRALVTRADHLTEEQMKNAEAMQRTQDETRLRRDTPAAATAPDAPTEEPAEV